MKNRFIIAVLSTTLLLSVCACANSKEKKDEKVVHKKKETMEVKQDAVSLPEEAETKPVADATLSDLYTDESEYKGKTDSYRSKEIRYNK